jgi:large subunit ribosomal protein L4
VRRSALRSVLSSKLEGAKLSVLESFPLDEIKTKAVANSLAPWSIISALIVIPAQDLFLEKSARNIPNIKVLRAEGLNCYDILHHDTLILHKDSLPLIEARLLRSAKK